MGIQAVAKLYKITDSDNVISCRVKSGSGWYPRYYDHYSGQAARDRLIARFIEAAERKGYVRVG